MAACTKPQSSITQTASTETAHHCQSCKNLEDTDSKMQRCGACKMVYLMRRKAPTFRSGM